MLMTKNYDKAIEINNNPNWPYIPDHYYGSLVIGGSGLGKANALSKLIKQQCPDIDKNYLHVKDPFDSWYELLIN